MIEGFPDKFKCCKCYEYLHSPHFKFRIMFPLVASSVSEFMLIGNLKKQISKFCSVVISGPTILGPVFFTFLHCPLIAISLQIHISFIAHLLFGLYLFGGLVLYFFPFFCFLMALNISDFEMVLESPLWPQVAPLSLTIQNLWR